jgi:hypothetical protein
MVFKKIIFKIGIYNYHGKLWGIGSIDEPPLHIFFHNFCNLMRCDGHHQFGWSKCVALSLWAPNNFVPMGNARGYEEFGNYSTLRYILVCHYSRRWILVLSPCIWVGRLCVLIWNITNYVRCDYKMCYFSNTKGFTFWCVIVERPRWLDVKGSHA